MIRVSCFSYITGIVRQMVWVRGGCWASAIRSFIVHSISQSFKRARFNISLELSPFVTIVYLFLLQYRAHDIISRKPERQGTTLIQLVMLP